MLIVGLDVNGTCPTNPFDFSLSCSYDEGYDPTAIMIDRIVAPWADIRFRGYLRGRSSLTLSLKQRGFSLQVHPALGFVVHRSHDQTRAQVRE